MAEIKINTGNLTAEIGKLKELKNSINNTNILCPATVGGGTSIQELEDIGKLYKSLHNQFGILVSSTASFMENVNQSYQSGDNKAAARF